MYRKHGSSVVSALASGARGPSSIPAHSESLNTLSLVSFAGMELDKSIELRMGTLTGCALCRESNPLCRLKNPIVMVTCRLSSCSPRCTMYTCR